MQNHSVWNLDHKKVIITGAASGIGLAITEAFLELGATVLMVDRDRQALDLEKQRLLVLGFPVDCIVADVTQAPDLQAVMQQMESFLGGLDVLVNNVGVNIRKPTLEYTAEDFHTIMSVNLESAFNLSRLFYPWLKASQQGPSIVNVSSLNSQRVIRFTSAMYTASKAALEQLSNFLAVEWAPEGIRVNSIHPWATRTPLAMDAFHKNPDIAEKIQKATPLGRIAEPEEVARVAAFLAMPAASYITGVNLAVDGGFSKLGF